MALVFKVRRNEPELVQPAQPTPNEVKSLSNADDQKMLRYQLSCVLFYNSAATDKDPAETTKRALAEALVYYYPWAGRLREGPDGRLVVDCTAEGATFVAADAEVRLDQFGEDSLQPPFPCMEDLLYNKASNLMATIGCPIFTMQVTRLLCGGFVLAFSFNHVMSDAIGVVQFVEAVSELARGAPAPSVLPVWQRELLNARDPPCVTCSAALSKFGDHYEVPTQDHVVHAPRPLRPPRLAPLLPSKAERSSNDRATYRSFFFGERELAAIHACVPQRLRDSCSSFELIAACVAHCRVIALQHAPAEQVRVVFPVNARRKLGVPAGYYGNACSPAMILCPAEKFEDVGYVVEEVKKAKDGVDEEYARTVIDLGVMGGRPRVPAMAHTYVVSDLSRVGLSGLDFGWGKPVYAGTADNGWLPHLLSFIVAFTNQKGEDGRLITLCLSQEAMDRFAITLRNLLQSN